MQVFGHFFNRRIEDRIPMLQDFSIGSLYDDVVNGGSQRTEAEAQQQAAAASQAQATKTQNMAISAATPTAEELLGISNQYANASAFMKTQIGNLQNSMQLLNSTQPSLMQAGIQAYQLMTGQAAASLAPIQNERALQRTQLQNSLQAKMGSGYATSSAGMEALSQFDQQTTSLMTNAQQSAIAQYLGVSASVMPNMTNLTNSVYGQGSNLTGAAIGATQSSQNMQLGAITGTASNMYNSAGAPWAGQGYLANAQGQLGNAAAGSFLSMMSGGSNHSPSPSPTPTQGNNPAAAANLFAGPDAGAGGSGAAAVMAG